MKAVQYTRTGGPDVLEIVEIAEPTPAPGQVRVAVAASAFNPADNGLRAGTLPVSVRLPHVPGYDVSGVVDAVGEGVDDLAVGDAVVGFVPMLEDGGAAEKVVAPAEAWVAAPTTVPLPDAAGLPSVALTAWQALFEHGELHRGQRVLIVGAGGVVGTYAVALASRAGAHVVATASARSIDKVRAAGADEILDRDDTALTDGVTAPVDVLLNLAPLEPEEFAGLVRLVRDGGRVVSATAWMPTPDDAERDVRGSTVFVRNDRAQLAELVALVDAGELTIEVTRRIPLAELPALHAEAAEHAISGKVVILP